MSKVKCRCVITVFFMVIAALLWKCHDIEYFLTAEMYENSSYAAAPELTRETRYSQQIPCLMDGTESIGLQFANYGDRENFGTIKVEIYASESEQLSMRYLDAPQIADGLYEYFPLSRSVDAGEMLQIDIVGDSEPGQGVTLWSTENQLLAQNGARFTVNGEPQPTQLNVAFGYQDPVLSPDFTLLLLLSCLILWFTGVPQAVYAQWRKRGIIQRLMSYAVLLLIGVTLVSLRNLQFISTPIIYGEDGQFLVRQMEDGLLRTLFETRGGSTADFSNTGVYLILWIASKTNIALNGYNLAAFPFWMGIYSNLFFAFTAVLGFRAFSLCCNRRAGVIAYLAVLLVNLGDSSAEVLGRALNMSFLWTATVAFLLMIQFQKDNQTGAESIAIGLLCFIGAFTFPVCFLEIGIYLIAVFLRSLKDRQWKKRVGANFVLIVAMAGGVWSLPRLLSSEGLGAVYTYQSQSAVEFFGARHILYPLVAMFYSDLSDLKVVVLCVLYIVIVALATVLQFRKTKYICNTYTVFAVITLGTCFSSAFMRRTLTALFNGYQWSYPDRYFYSCNILSMLLFFFALYIIAERIPLKRLRILPNMLVAFCLLINSDLFYFTNPNYNILFGKEYLGTFAENCEKAVRETECIDWENGILVALYPNGWNTSFPVQYVLSTTSEQK